MRLEGLHVVVEHGKSDNGSDDCHRGDNDCYEGDPPHLSMLRRLFDVHSSEGGRDRLNSPRPQRALLYPERGRVRGMERAMGDRERGSVTERTLGNGMPFGFLFHILSVDIWIGRLQIPYLLDQRVTVSKQVMGMIRLRERLR